ncbi:MAG TPA: DUF4258 domain-containing protein [Caulobacteraceae bacterium]|nr:DUF4258 domain-containing protein [Caulobacteraceae bacterium]
MKRLILSRHAEVVAEERRIERDWIERAAREPEWRAPDADASAERRFVTVPERGDRVLRVVCRENDIEIRVITVFLDRRAKRPA